MKKLVILLLLILVASSLFAGTYKARVSMSSGAAVTEPLVAKLGYKLPVEPIPLIEKEEAKLLTFTLYNRFPTFAWVTVIVVNKPGSFTITLPSPQPIIVPVYPYFPADDISITYKATDEGNYIVTYRVIADILDVGGRAHVELIIDVPFTVEPPPPPVP
jgi:hypothetical protein